MARSAEIVEVDLTLALADLEDRRMAMEAAQLRSLASRNDLEAAARFAEQVGAPPVLVTTTPVPAIKQEPEPPPAPPTSIAERRARRSEQEAAAAASEAITDARLEALEKTLDRHNRMWTYLTEIEDGA